MKKKPHKNQPPWRQALISFISIQSETGCRVGAEGQQIEPLSQGQYLGEGATHCNGGLDNNSLVEDMSDFGHSSGTGPLGGDNCYRLDLLDSSEERDTLVGAIHSLENTIAGHCHLLNRVKNRKDKPGSIAGKNAQRAMLACPCNHSQSQLATNTTSLPSSSKGAVRGDKASVHNICSLGYFLHMLSHCMCFRCLQFYN